MRAFKQACMEIAAELPMVDDLVELVPIVKQASQANDGFVIVGRGEIGDYIDIADGSAWSAADAPEVTLTPRAARGANEWHCGYCGMANHPRALYCGEIIDGHGAAHCGAPKPELQEAPPPVESMGFYRRAVGQAAPWILDNLGMTIKLSGR